MSAAETPRTEFDATWTIEYPDSESLGQALVAVAGLAVIGRPEREEELSQAIVDGLAAYRMVDGCYRLSDEFHFLISRA